MATHCISHALYNPTDPDMENMSETYDNSRSVETVVLDGIFDQGSETK